jgi:preprotein translocase subunit Sec63
MPTLHNGQMSTSIAEAFRILELDEDASFTEVKQAYRLLVKVWHPDRFTEDIDLQKAAEAKLKEVNLAYELLKSIEALWNRAVELAEGKNKDLTQSVNSLFTCL